MSLLETIENCRVLPVVVVSEPTDAVKLANVLLKSGMQVIEVTLRTPHSLACIEAIKSAVPGMMVAAGTVKNADDMAAASEAGADFFVSPGISVELLQAASARGGLLIPGVATASEVMLGMEHGLQLLKLFPAEAVGGVSLLKSLAGPFPDVRFCPTGGLNAKNFRSYLALANVGCVGGSWMVKASLIEDGQWDVIETLARDALQDSA